MSEVISLYGFHILGIQKHLEVYQMKQYLWGLFPLRICLLKWRNVGPGGDPYALQSWFEVLFKFLCLVKKKRVENLERTPYALRLVPVQFPDRCPSSAPRTCRYIAPFSVPADPADVASLLAMALRTLDQTPGQSVQDYLPG